MANKKQEVASKAPVQKPQSFGRWFWGRVLGLIGKHARLVILTFGICTCVWLISDALKFYAGKQSDANLRFGLDNLADIRMVYTLSIAFGTTGIGL